MAKKVNTARTLLRDWDTGFFFREPNAWVANLSEASDFQNVEQVIQRSRFLGRPRLEFLVVSEEGRPIWGGQIAETYLDR
jgi:hypothetical protein